jgi:plasmid replication initiation protein
VRAGRDEMNLVEYPFAALAKHGGTKSAKIEQTWETTHPISGRPVTARWRVIGDPDLGLPTPQDERVYLVLMEITKDQGFTDKHITFTRYDLLKRLGWPADKAHYEMLYAAFQRLKALSITAENSFWDASAKSFRNVGFSLIDNFDIIAAKPGRKALPGSRGRKKKSGETDFGEPELSLSWFKWNEVVFESARNGYIKTLDLDFALSLDTPLSLRLYRYLDKKRRSDGAARYTFQIEIHLLCERHLGMTPQRFVSTLKSRLEGAHAELAARGFLKGVQYLPMRSRPGEKVIYTFGERPLPAEQAPPREPKRPKTTEERDKEVLAEASLAVLAELPEDEREAIDAEARSGFPDFMLERLSEPESMIFKEHRRVTCDIVQRDHYEDVQKQLRRMVTKPG